MRVDGIPQEYSAAVQAGTGVVMENKTTARAEMPLLARSVSAASAPCDHHAARARAAVNGITIKALRRTLGGANTASSPRDSANGGAKETAIRNRSSAASFVFADTD